MKRHALSLTLLLSLALLPCTQPEAATRKLVIRNLAGTWHSGVEEFERPLIAMNNRGEVCATLDSANTPYLWSNGRMRSLPVARGKKGRVYCIDNLGRVFGTTYRAHGDPLQVQLVVWNGGSPQVLDSPPGPSLSSPDDVNTAGQITGSIRSEDQHTHAALWTPEQVLDLGTPEGDNYSLGWWITEDGDVFGESIAWPEDDDPTADVRYHFFRWHGGQMQLLLDPQGSPENVQVMDVNARGEAVGTTGDGLQVVIWKDGAPELIVLPQSVAWGTRAAINDLGEVVIQAVDRKNRTHLVLWREGHSVDAGVFTLKRFETFTLRAMNNQRMVLGIHQSLSGGSPPAIVQLPKL